MTSYFLMITLLFCECHKRKMTTILVYTETTSYLQNGRRPQSFVWDGRGGLSFRKYKMTWAWHSSTPAFPYRLLHFVGWILDQLNNNYTVYLWGRVQGWQFYNLRFNSLWERNNLWYCFLYILVTEAYTISLWYIFISMHSIINIILYNESSYEKSRYFYL